MMEKIIDAVVESGLRDQMKIMVGGAPVTQVFADDIGARAQKSVKESEVIGLKQDEYRPFSPAVLGVEIDFPRTCQS